MTTRTLSCRLPCVKWSPVNIGIYDNHERYDKIFFGLLGYTYTWTDSQVALRLSHPNLALPSIVFRSFMHVSYNHSSL